MAAKSAFVELGLKKTLGLVQEEVQELYALDDVPWIIGYSGGKDSTACVQIIWNSLLALPESQRLKIVHVITTDTLVENPIVSNWVSRSLDQIQIAATEQNLPIQVHQLKPGISDSFWVNLLGKGYPSPRPQFRWCTERLKIRPSNAFISSVVKDRGEAILVLGTRKQESIARGRVMARHAEKKVRDRLTPNSTLLGTLIYTPIEDWSNDDVWTYLTQVKNPWNFPNEQLLGMYAGATEGGECPLVVDTTTPSCGDSRFGCWVCTLVDKDKSMSAMIQNDTEKEWMLPLLEFRSDLDTRDRPGEQEGEGMRRDRANRDFRRLPRPEQQNKGTNPEKVKTANLDLYLYKQINMGIQEGGITSAENLDLSKVLVHGPYRQAHREHLLSKLLQAQRHIREHGGPSNSAFEIISTPELAAIRRIWVLEKHEIEDTLPRIYREAMGEDYPGAPLDDECPLDHGALSLLHQTCEALREGDEDPEIRYRMVRELLSHESRFRTRRRRSGLFEELKETVRLHQFWNEADAAKWAIDEAVRKVAPKIVTDEISDKALVISIKNMDSESMEESELPEAFA